MKDKIVYLGQGIEAENPSMVLKYLLLKKAEKINLDKKVSKGEE